MTGQHTVGRLPGGDGDGAHWRIHWTPAQHGTTDQKAEVFSALDQYVLKLTCKRARYRPADKPKRWIAGRYFGAFSKFRNDR